MASVVLPEHELYELLKPTAAVILATKERVHSHENLFAGAVSAFADDIRREAAFRTVVAGLSEEDTVRLLVLAPYRKGTWILVDALSETVQSQYWREVKPDWIHDSDSENNESVERLLKAGRPRAAFACATITPSKIDAVVLFRILFDITRDNNDQPGEYMLDNYHIQEAFRRLNGNSGLTLDQKAGLEFAYLEALGQPVGGASSYGIPNLERYVEEQPELFVRAITWTYKRTDGESDPAEFQIPSERIQSMADRGYKLVEAIKRIPGHNDLDELEAPRLAKWIDTVRRASAELSRADIADVCIGKVLSCAPIGSDGIWPCEPVRDVMEEIQSEPMMRGAHTGVYNSRGVHWRGHGGGQERELAAKYRKWGQALQVSHPFVASKLLLVLAKTYDHEASHEDEDARLSARLR